MGFSSALEKIKSGQHLTISESEKVLVALFEYDLSEDLIFDFLSALTDKGETANELVGFCLAMKKYMIKVPLPTPLLDVCGTGGSGKSRFNVSTASAFVLASAGVPVAKHGNRGSKNFNGSFDFLEALEIPFGQQVDQLLDIFQSTQLNFFFARTHHPTVSKVALARKRIAKPTIFNLIGPLCNPAPVTHQLLGTSSQGRAQLLTEAILQLGIHHALVVVGENGRDEISASGPTQIFEIKNKNIKTYTLLPDFLTTKVQDADLTGGDATQNAALFLNIIRTQAIDHPICEWLCLNAGAGFYLFGKAFSIEAGYQLSRSLIYSGQVSHYFDRYQLATLRNAQSA